VTEEVLLTRVRSSWSDRAPVAIGIPASARDAALVVRVEPRLERAARRGIKFGCTLSTAQDPRRIARLVLRIFIMSSGPVTASGKPG